MDAALEITGAADVARLLRRVSASDLEKSKRAASLAAATGIAARSKSRAPVRTGRLQSTIRAGVTARGGVVRMGAVRGVQYQNVIHWGRRDGNVGSSPGNHKGHNRVNGRPFIWQEAQRSAGVVAVEYERELSRLFSRVLGR